MEQAPGNDQIRTIPEDEAGVVILNGEPYMNINGRYVLEAEAQVIFQHRKVLKEQKKLEEMENALFAKSEQLKSAKDKKEVKS